MENREEMEMHHGTNCLQGYKKLDLRGGLDLPAPVLFPHQNPEYFSRQCSDCERQEEVELLDRSGEHPGHLSFQLYGDLESALHLTHHHLLDLLVPSLIHIH